MENLKYIHIYLREDRHDIGTIDFVAKNISCFLDFVEVRKKSS